MDYSALCKVYEQLESTPKRLEKTALLADLFKTISSGELEQLMLLVQGLVYPAWDERTLGFSSSSVIKALSLAAGVSEDAVKEVWRETGDLGSCALRLMGKKKQSTLFGQKLTVRKVFENIRKLSEIEGEQSVDLKVGKVAELLSNATPMEACFIVRTVLDELRIGLGEGTLRDALVWSFLPRVLGISVPYKKGDDIGDALIIHGIDEINENRLGGVGLIFSEEVAREVHNLFLNRVQHALDVCNDFGRVASVLKEKGLAGLREITLTVGTPLKVMLALKQETIASAFERVGKPAALEYKLDGFRLQIHKINRKISLFTRRLENVTAQFPDIVVAVEKHVKCETFILDCEVVGVDKVSGKFLPFQNISQRIKRKYDIAQVADDVPVELHVFDILFFDGHSCLDEPFSERRALLRKVVGECEHVRLVTQLWTDDVNEATEFYQQALDAGNEGIMFKSLSAVYRPGSRVGAMVKMKPVMETLDLVIVGAEWGEGKRGQWLSSFLLACYDHNSGELLEIGRVSTGLKEKKEEGLSFEEMTSILKELILKQKGREVVVKPHVVLEVAFEEVQKSSSYNSGFALRFPRVVRLREDRDASSCSTLKDVKRMFEGQHTSK